MNLSRIEMQAMDALIQIPRVLRDLVKELHELRLALNRTEDETPEE